jgi:hypothetical protein
LLAARGQTETLMKGQAPRDAVEPVRARIEVTTALVGMMRRSGQSGRNFDLAPILAQPRPAPRAFEREG